MKLITIFLTYFVKTCTFLCYVKTMSKCNHIIALGYKKKYFDYQNKAIYVLVTSLLTQKYPHSKITFLVKEFYLIMVQYCLINIITIFFLLMR